TPAVREQLLPCSWGQKQIVDASHLVVFAVKKNMGPADAERLVQQTATVRGVPVAALEGYKGMMANSLTSKSAEVVETWMSRQCFIALGQFMVACAALGVDACPMEGFEPEKYDSILGLTAKGYASVVVATAGYRAADDAYGNYAKVRYPIAEMVEHL
ncbi:MAG: nitroreductase family protein, partial [Gemmataceae bacterium]